MQNELISIVLPIYNVEKYLNRCIESVINQSYSNLEIILVDDGSPDHCPQICEDWAKKDSRIRVVHKKNAGLGMARNTGIDHASGKYICFFDSDDYISLNTIELVYAQIKRTDAQIVCFGHHDVDFSGKILDSHVPDCPKTIFSDTQVQEIFLPNLIASAPSKGENWKLNMSAWSAMFSMDLIRQTGWRFVSERDILSEDIYSLTDLYQHVQRVAVLNEALYFYCINDQSLSRSYRNDRFERNIIFYQECLKLCDRLGYSDDVRMRLSRYMFSNSTAAMKQLILSDKPFIQKISELRNILNHHIWKTFLLRKLIHHESSSRRILLWCILHKHTFLCYSLVFLKNQCTLKKRPRSR